MKRQNPQQAITNYIDVPSIDEYVDKVNKLGGKVAVPKMAVPGAGYLEVCLILKITVLESGKGIQEQNN